MDIEIVIKYVPLGIPAHTYQNPMYFQNFSFITLLKIKMRLSSEDVSTSSSL